MGDGKMSRDHLEHTLKNAEAGHPMMGKWADAVRAHIAALEAEIATLKPSGQVAEDAEKVREWLHIGNTPTWAPVDVRKAQDRLATKAQGYDAAVADNAAMVARALAVEADTSTSAQRQKVARHIIGDGDHPGAALLEEHRSHVATLVLAKDVACAMHEAAQKARLEERDQHAKALVRAMNEGLEKAAHCAQAHSAVMPDSVAEAIRAMKEPEQ